MEAYYDRQIVATVAASERPLRHRDIAAQLAPGDSAAWNQIGNALTHLYRAGQLQREKTDGRYWHYTIGGPPMSEHARLAAADLDYAQQLLARAERAEAEAAELRAEMESAHPKIDEIALQAVLLLSERDTLRADNARLRTELDRERGNIPGKYAFLHRHYAMRFVRQKDQALHDWAASEAGQQLDRDGALSYVDYVARLETALAALVDDSPCRYDHHGDCQEHGLSPRPCRMEVARRLVEGKET